MMKKVTWGRSCLPSKRAALEALVYPQLQEEIEVELTDKEKFTCLVRNFILQQASEHRTYDPVRTRVALPCLVQAWSGNPWSEVHLHCLCNYELTQREREELRREDALAKTVKR